MNQPPATAAAQPSASRARGLARLWTPPRIIGLDVARGLAIVGMIGAHTLTLAPFSWGDPSTWGDIVTGRSSILFGVIAGISIALMTRDRPTDRDGLRRERLRLVGRGATIFLVGLVLELLRTGIAIILGMYGLLFIAVIPFLSWRRRSLLVGAGVLAVTSSLVVSPLLELTGGVGFGQIGMAVLGGAYAPLEWVCLLLVGLAIGRSRFTTPRFAALLLAGGIGLTAVGYTTGALAAPTLLAQPESQGAQDAPQIVDGADLDLSDLTCERYDAGDVYCVPDPADPASPTAPTPDLAGSAGALVVRGLLTSEPHSGGLAEIVGSVGVALIVIGGCLLVGRAVRGLLAPLAAMGSMPLTSYSVQVVIIAIATPFGASGLALWAGMTVGIAAASTLWVWRLGRGPLERLLDRSARWWSVDGTLSRADRSRVS